MKTYFSGLRKMLLAFAVLTSLGVAAYASLRPSVPPSCEYEGTFVHIPCATGAYGPYWLKLKGGKLLHPCTGVSISVDPRELVGKVIKIGAVSNNECRGPAVICSVPVTDYSNVDITCLSY